jgi:hypothetical protein
MDRGETVYTNTHSPTNAGSQAHSRVQSNNTTDRDVSRVFRELDLDDDDDDDFERGTRSQQMADTYTHKADGGNGKHSDAGGIALRTFSPLLRFARGESNKDSELPY